MAAVLAAWHAEHFDGPDLREHLSRFLLPGNRKPVRRESLIYMFDYTPLDGALETFE